MFWWKSKRLRITAIVLAVLGVGSLVAYQVISARWVDKISPAEARAAGTADDGKRGTGGGVDCEKAKCVALTFDGGPGKDTPELLDLLEREEVPATFFLLGRKHIERYPDTVRRIAEEGHEVANHTWNHPRLTEVSGDEVRAELTRTQKAIEDLTGVTPTLMRPPQGRTNKDVSEICRELGLAQILWSVTAKDYSTTDSALIRKRVLDQVERDGIILLHDIYDGTVPAVPGIISELKKRGYTFVTVPQLLAPGSAEPGKAYR
ncbi:polysaccharide deacetylase family protein [Streptomyces alkaliterrae]|uniref:Polysaccharide deacetylase family protein n=1 Tax=Streptomyces alkaliterrae TaxID=2213162 RepID=A0A5P0YUD4_9ACTN|nr:polysaccharide deacetylase family protein [Streptomyces alkaliterrae]MBB1256180.1 polysaccharide deacetylase family protein [Streptomyces alkaliterrae]MBB1262108.1 polysaccharide deacetylase family protein [Streptomyces alkaliterrae]MQS03924.1 polysaccharide deacetylase family protein [Streptomyces alkaliterrae]